MTDDMLRASALLKRFIEIPSVNPEYDPESLGERAVALQIGEYCAALGMSVQYDDVFPGRPNVEARLSAPNPRGTLLFEVHTDTVALPHSQDVPVARSEGTLMFGRGACDVKGGLVAVLMALTELAADRENLGVDVLLIGAADEESQYQGVLKYLESDRDIDAAVVLEPTGLQTVVGHSGVVRLSIAVDGVSAHSSRPEQGRNAITDAYTVISALESWINERSQITLSAPLQPPVLSVNRIAGGHAFNIIPDRCTIDLDMRTLPTDDPQVVAEEIAALLAGLSSVGVTTRIVDAPVLMWGLAPEMSSAIVAAASEVSRRQDVDPTVGYVTFGTDASKLAKIGAIPSIVLGPGSIEQAHTDDEFVDLRDVVKARDLYRDIVHSFASLL